jgi:hypothetical protein
MWRMLLEVCKQLRSTVSVVFIGLLFFSVSAEGVKSSSSKKKQAATEDLPSDLPVMPALPSITSPSMPTISAPTIGSSFYTPGISTAASSSETDSPQQKSSDTVSSPSSPVPAAVQNGTSISASGINGLSSSVSASDLSSLDSAGLLGSLYSSLRSPLTADTSSTNTMLSNILQQLKELKQENKSVITDYQTEKKSDITNSSAARKDSTQPAILRFTVNGYDILATCRTIYFSDRENDGSFLLTGDRKYTSDGKTRDETFYLLFRTKGSAGISTQYDVKPAVVQDYVNKYSFIYQLAQKNNLSASKTGNLITMRLNEPVYNMDLLIDIGNKNNK